MIEFYCPKCRRFSAVNRENFVLTPGEGTFVCEHCGTAWRVQIEFHAEAFLRLAVSSDNPRGEPSTQWRAVPLEMWTDGSCDLSNKTAGWGAVWGVDGHVLGENSGTLPMPTSGKLSSSYVEILAVLHGLLQLESGLSVTLHCDNVNVVGWLSRDWKVKSSACKIPLLWVKRLIFENGFDLTVKKVSGDAPEHKRAHDLANAARTGN